MLLALLTVTATSGVFVNPTEAQALRDAGARVLDARGAEARAPYMSSAVVVDWTGVRAGILREGRLGEADTARAAYAAKGVRLDTPVLVYGAADEGWGEEGRIWWDLSYLGHPEVYILDGGLSAWKKAGGRLASVPSGPLEGDFPTVPSRTELRASTEMVRDALGGATVLVDSRTLEEYRGATPYGSTRGGHVPGARQLHWRSLLDANGRLLPEPRLHARLGTGPGIAYCTGGVRSAFVVAVATHLGLPYANYDGSWWLWSARSELPVASMASGEVPASD